MKKIIYFLSLAVILTACKTVDEQPNHLSTENSWVMVYSNDKDGMSLEGSKSDLIESIRQGNPVRIYTSGRRIEHAMEAQFLSIFKGDVFAQITPIHAQAPAEDPTQILFRAPGKKWQSIVGTNGFVTAFTDGGDPNIRKGSTKWFVQK